jgi:hypothetical protein
VKVVQQEISDAYDIESGHAAPEERPNAHRKQRQIASTPVAKSP